MVMMMMMMTMSESASESVYSGYQSKETEVKMCFKKKKKNQVIKMEV